MGKKTKKPRRSKPPPPSRITAVTVGGYKSLVDKRTIQIKPLTILAGANSSGKSSIVQPLLLFKQTLEASYDPGPLLLNGPNVKFTSAEQFLPATGRGRKSPRLHVGFETNQSDDLSVTFAAKRAAGLDIVEMGGRTAHQKAFHLTPEMSQAEVLEAIPYEIQKRYGEVFSGQKLRWSVKGDRCFLDVVLTLGLNGGESEFSPWLMPYGVLSTLIQDVIHLPGLRGNPERTYPVGAVGHRFPSTFENYTASVILHWQTDKQDDKSRQLMSDLGSLGLTWKVLAQAVDQTQVELRVGRLTHAKRGGGSDLVSIADVGIGVSQALPVLVALLEARPGQLVFLEQPEIHLHPRAQVALAPILARAAQRGVQVVVETHSAVLLLAIQTLVAESKFPGDKAILHWFSRQNGQTEIASKTLDKHGAFGDWPEDFGEVALELESRYLDATESSLPGIGDA